MGTRLDEKVTSLLEKLAGYRLITSYGICPHQELQLLVEEGILPKGPRSKDDDIESSTVNLRNSGDIWDLGVMQNPGMNYTVNQMLKKNGRKLSGDKKTLQPENTYAVKIEGSIDFLKYSKNPDILEHILSFPIANSLQGIVEPKSSSGRMFLDVRSITDNSNDFNNIPISYKGDLYLLVTPLVNPCILGPGDSLAQLITGTSIQPISSDEVRYIHEQEWPLFWEHGEPVKDLAIKHGQVFVKPELSPKDGGDHVALKMVKHHNNEKLEIGKGPETHSAQEFYQKVYLGQEENLYGRPKESLLVLTTPSVSVPPYLLMRMVQLPAYLGRNSTHEAGLINAGDGFGGADGVHGSHMLCEVTIDERSGRKWTKNQDITSFHVYRLRRPSDYPYQGKNYKQQEQQGIRLPKIFKNDI
jgi:deoxycytidine triphosphate deaminase